MEKKELWKYKYLILISIIFLIISMIANAVSGNYVTYSIQAVEVPDLILDHIGPWDWTFSLTYGSFVFFYLLFVYPIVWNVAKLHVITIQYALLSVIRSVFMALTHLKTPIDAIPLKFPGYFDVLVFSNDLFFSGHVAWPFLGFLVFRKSKIRWIFLAGSIYMGITVLVTHRHYSIDVLAAFFITYGSFKIGEKLVKYVEKIKRKKE